MEGISGVKRILKTFLFSAVTTAVLLLILSAICSIADIGIGVLRPVVFCISAASVFLWSFISAKGIQRGGFIHGGAAGLLYGVCFAVISAVYSGGDIAAVHIATMFFAVAAAGALGGILGINSVK